jgi:hypothetical protein
MSSSGAVNATKQKALLALAFAERLAEPGAFCLQHVPHCKTSSLFASAHFPPSFHANPLLIAAVCVQLFDLFLEDFQVLAALVHAHSLQLQHVATEAGLVEWGPPLPTDLEVMIFAPPWYCSSSSMKPLQQTPYSSSRAAPDTTTIPS